MIEKTLKVLDEKEFRAIEILRNAGLKRPEAYVLLGLSTIEDFARLIDVERVTGLRQPEVVTGYQYLESEGWVQSTYDLKSQPRGRPFKMIKLTVPFKSVVQTLINRKKGELKEIVDGLESIKDL